MCDDETLIEFGCTAQKELLPALSMPKEELGCKLVSRTSPINTGAV